QPASCCAFSWATNTNCPGRPAAANRIPAPLPNTSTVCVASENGWRLSLPATVLAPFTVTGISIATGSGLAPPGAAALICPVVSEAISYLLAELKISAGRARGSQNTSPGCPHIGWWYLKQLDDSTRVLPWKPLS